jgi:hypothetical protein
MLRLLQIHSYVLHVSIFQEGFFGLGTLGQFITFARWWRIRDPLFYFSWKPNSKEIEYPINTGS